MPFYSVGLHRPREAFLEAERDRLPNHHDVAIWDRSDHGLELKRLQSCPNRKDHGEYMCVDGEIWALTYSECAPPDQRQFWGPCTHCYPKQKEPG